MNDSKHLPPSALEEWLAAAAAELGLEPSEVPIGAVLDIARDVAHGVARPAAPLTTFLVGLALGKTPGADFEDLSKRVTALALGWAADSDR